MKSSSRRTFLERAGALAAGTVVGPSVLRATAADAAACSQVVVTTWGGDYQKLLQAYTDPGLKPNPAGIVYDIGIPEQRKTKLMAEKALKRGTLDVVHFDDMDMYAAYAAGTLTKIDYSKLSNGKYVIKDFGNDYSVPHIYSAQVILYNPEHVKPAPNSYNIFWDPKYKGRVGIQHDQHKNWLQIAASVSGGNASNYEPGKAKLLELKKLEPKVYASQEELAQGLKSGEVWLTPNWRARAYFWKKRGIPVENASPKEGSLPVLFRATVAKNAPDRQCAMDYLNAMLAPASQVDFAKGMGYNPTVNDAAIPDDLKAQIGFSDAERKNFFKVNYDYLTKNDAAWLEWWTKSFLA